MTRRWVHHFHPLMNRVLRMMLPFLSPQLAPFVHSVYVDQHALFSGHNPLCFSLGLPLTPPMKDIWMLPQPWICLEPQQRLVQEYFAQFVPDPTIVDNSTHLHPLTWWSRQVEKSVHCALREQHVTDPVKFPTDGLPKKFRGRCKTRQIVQAPWPKSIPAGRSGDFTPTIESTAIAFRQQVKQLRRIQSLRRRVSKLSHFNPVWPETISQIQTEWKRILSAPGFYPIFPTWVNSFPEIQPLTHQVPTTEVLYDIEQILHMHVQQETQYQRKVATERAAFRMKLDCTKGSKKMAFRSVKEDGPGLLQEIEIQKQSNFTLVSHDFSGLILLRMPPESTFQTQEPFWVEGQQASFVSWDSPILELMIHDALAPLPNTGVVLQKAIVVQPDRIAQSLTDFWNQYWQHDNPETLLDNDCWAQFNQLLNQLPQADVMTLQELNLTFWRKAISQLKATTARGSCGWAPDELKQLPDNAIISLMHVFLELQTTSLPPWFMHARTVPLAKKHGANDVSQSRPITVLPLLYRCWGKCICSQILQTWAALFPESVSGFLPGRSPQRSLYSLQLQLELNHLGIEQTSYGGLTLDLVKCFNTLPRRPCLLLMLRLGIPPKLAEFWYRSINNMSRSWSLNGSMHFSGKPTTGFPEGDTFSVLTMLAVNRLWSKLLSTVAVHPNSFADNWSWWTPSPDQHFQAIKHTVELASAIHVTIDWNKTWIWSTDVGHATALHEAFAHLVNTEVTLKRVQNARELGYIMHYQRRQGRSSQKTRHLEALQRLARLAKKNFDLSTTAMIAHMTGTVKALWGTEFYVCGQQYFSQLRTAIAKALVGPYHNTNPFLAVMCLSEHCIDPELHTILLSIHAARDFLQFASFNEIQAFLRIASRPGCKPTGITGPAAAFSNYISRLGWSIDRQGLLHVDAFLRISLLDSDIHSLTQAAICAWMQCVSDNLVRKGLRNTPVIDRAATIKALHALPQHMRKTIAMDIVGAFMTQNQKHHFDPDTPEQCEFCDLPDGLAHRVLHCPAQSEVRDKYADIVDHLMQHDPVHVNLPVIFQDPMYELHRLLHFQAPSPDCDIPSDLDPDQVIYTDGSCREPDLPQHRWAGFSMVVAKCPESNILGNLHLGNSHLLNQCYFTIAVGHCQGRQSIPRAELLALVTLWENHIHNPVGTDSAYVLHIAQLLQHLSDVRILHKHGNYDLIRRAFFNKPPNFSAQTIFKIKAHEELHATSVFLTLHRAGNAAADEAAKQITQTAGSTVNTERSQIAADFRSSKRTLAKHYEFRYELARHRISLSHGQSTTVEPTNSPVTSLDRLLDWTVSDPIEIRWDQLDMEIIKGSRWGTAHAGRLLCWLKTLKWPKHPEPIQPPYGITWLELLINFLICTQQSVPVNCNTTGGRAKYRYITEDGEWDHTVFSFGAFVQSFRLSIDQLQAMTTVQLIPVKSRIKIKSLRILAGLGHKQGIPLRPQLPSQRVTVKFLQEYLRLHPDMHEYPQIPTAVPIDLPDFDDFSV